MTSHGEIPLPLAALERIDRACTRFEHLWRTGPRPDLGDFLAGADDERRALFRELLKVELEYRLKRGEQPAADEYGRRFPDDDGAAAFAAVVREHIAGDDGDGQSHDSLSATTSAPHGAAAPLPPGPLDRYRVERILGQGAFGTVYLVEDLKLHRMVALKVAHDARPLQGDVDAFLAEARVLASLDHPAVLPVYDAGRAAGRSYLVTKLIDGSTLAERLRQGLPAHRQAAEWLSAAARGLQAAHEKGLVHRDVKPSNVLIDRAEKAYVGDFGLALRGEQFGQGPRLLGTPAYMSPEQARGEGHQVDARSDVFSLGVVLYEMLTGRPPFQAATVTKTLKHVAELEPVAPVRLNPTVGRDLDTICLKCLEKRPERRYVTAGALAEDLQRFLDHRPILARPAGPVEKLARWGRRNPLVAASLAVAAVTFVAAFALVSWSYLRAEAAYTEEAWQRQEAQRREKAERWERYRANMVAAASAIQSHGAAPAREALDAAPPEHRNWEWHYFDRQLDTADHVLRGPPGVNGASVSAAGTRVALTYRRRPPLLFDIPGRRIVGPLGPADPGDDAAVSPDGKTLVFTSAGGDAIVLWDTAAGRPRAVVRDAPKTAGRFHFSPDGTRLAAAAADRIVRVWDAATGAELHALRGHRSVPGHVAFSPDGQRIASAGEGDRTVRLWDATDGGLLADLGGHDADVRFVAFSPGGDRVVAREGYPSNLMRLWDVASGRPLGVLRGHTNEVLAVTFSPAGDRIATASYDQTARLWDARTGAPLAVLRGHKGWVTCVAFSPDGARVATGSPDRTVRTWNAETGEPLDVLLGHASRVLDVGYADGGATLVSAAADGSVRLWDARRAGAGVLTGHAADVYGVAVHPDGRRVASSAWDGTVRLWDGMAGRLLAVLEYPAKTVVGDVAFHPDGKVLASVGRDSAVRLWDVDTGREVGRVPVPTDYPSDTRVTFSPRGDLLACGGIDGAVYVWGLRAAPGGKHLPDGPPVVLRGHKDVVKDVAVARDGAWLASAGSGKDGTVRIWDLARRAQVQSLDTSDEASALAVAPDGSLLAAGCGDGTVRLWDTRTWRPAGVLTQGSVVYGLAFTPDGTRLACACDNHTIRLWDVATRQAVCALHGHGAYVHQVAFSPDGTRLVSASGDRTVRVWDGRPRPPVPGP